MKVKGRKGEGMRNRKEKRWEGGAGKHYGARERERGKGIRERKQWEEDRGVENHLKIEDSNLTFVWLQQTVRSSCWSSHRMGISLEPTNKRFNSAYHHL